jgi:formylmethanofuran dehydrogenase subunit B
MANTSGLTEILTREHLRTVLSMVMANGKRSLLMMHHAQSLTAMKVTISWTEKMGGAILSGSQVIPTAVVMLKMSAMVLAR